VLAVHATGSVYPGHTVELHMQGVGALCTTPATDHDGCGEEKEHEDNDDYGNWSFVLEETGVKEC
jgi:hypothetical protein